MKTSKKSHWVWLNVFIISLLSSLGAGAQPMSPEARKNIHSLFNQHERITRSVELTENGYVSLTETDDPKLASILKSHVRQMRTRLKSGKMVRRWDPAFPEIVMHYENMQHKIEPTNKGIKVTVIGTSPEAIKVAQNHAKIVSAFAEKGWDEHDIRHPTVLTESDSELGESDSKPTQESKCCGKGCKETDQSETTGACGKSCCLKDAKNKTK